MATSCPEIKIKEWDNNGNPAVGYKLYAYESGTVTPLDTYTDADGAVPNTNPVVLDSRGEATIYLGTKAYTFALTDPNDATIWTRDDVSGPADASTTSITVDTVADMKALTGLVDGAVIFTRGYTSAGDGGHGEYLYYATPPGTEDDFIYHNQTTGGGQFKLISAKKNVLQAGAASDPVAAMTACAAYGGDIYIPENTTLTFAALDVLDSFTDVNFIGEGRNSTIGLGGSNFYFRAHTNVTFININFVGTYSDSNYDQIYASKYNGLHFAYCRFYGFGGGTGNKAGSNALLLWAGDTNNSQLASGNSENATIHKCEFDGAARFTNFGVRVYTEFVSPETATNKFCRITDSKFKGFNWNAVEIAGPNTSHVIVTNCQAEACGLCPFEIDKGAHDCYVGQCTINRLLGNIDTIANPNTRSCVATIQGISSTTGYAYNNIVDGIVANLLAADVAAYSGRGVVAASCNYAKDSVIKNITVNIDSVPSRPVSAPFAAACVSFETISNVIIEGVNCKNFTAGIVETAANNAGVGSDWCYIRRIKNNGTMKAEVYSKSFTSAATFKYLFSNIEMTTDMLDSITPASLSVIDLVATATNPAIAAFKDISVVCSNASANGVNFSCVRASFHNVNLDIPTPANWFKAASSGTRLHYGENYCGTVAVNVDNAFLNLAATCAVYQGAAEPLFANYQQTSCLMWIATAAPTNPPAAFFVNGAKVAFTTPVTAGYIGSVKTAAGWKSYGLIT